MCVNMLIHQKQPVVLSANWTLTTHINILLICKYMYAREIIEGVHMAVSGKYLGGGGGGDNPSYSAVSALFCHIGLTHYLLPMDYGQLNLLSDHLADFTATRQPFMRCLNICN